MESGKLEFEPSQIKNSEDDLIIASLENSWNMLRRSKNRLLANHSGKEPAATNPNLIGRLNNKEREWLAEIEQSQLALIRQADEAGLLKFPTEDAP